MDSSSIPECPNPKEQPAAARDSSTGVNAPKSSAGLSGLGLSCSCHQGPRWAPGLGTAPPPQGSPKPQSAGRCAPPSAAASSSRWRGSGRPAGEPWRAAAPGPAVKVAEPERGLAAAAEPGSRRLGTQRGVRGRGRRGECARLRRGRRAPATRAPLTQLGDVRLSLRPQSVRLRRRPPRAARCPARGPQLAITGTTTSTRSPNSRKSASSLQPLICIPEVAPQAPVRAPLRPPPPRSSPAGRCRRLAGGSGRHRGVSGGVRRRFSGGSGSAPSVFRFFQRDFPGSSDISNPGVSFPSRSGFAHSPISSGSRLSRAAGRSARSRSAARGGPLRIARPPGPRIPSNCAQPPSRSRLARTPLRPAAPAPAVAAAKPFAPAPSLYYQAAHYHRGRSP